MKKLSLLFISIFIFSGCSYRSGLILSSPTATIKIATFDDVYCGASEGATITLGDFTIESFLHFLMSPPTQSET